jgi:hypothetical protein
MIAHPFLLPLLLGLGLGAVYVLPKAGKTAQSAVSMNLPGSTGGWSFEKILATEAELETLSKDTEFSKAICLQPRPGEIDENGYLIPDRIDISVVLSGHDLNNSIHRPERCMPAQGHRIHSSSDVLIKGPESREFEAKRLLSVQTIKDSKTGKAIAELNCITYYFFVGHEVITNDHLDRTIIDMKDRLVYGRDQRWAYVSTSMWYGKIPWIKDKEVTEKEADEKLRAFVSGFSEKQIDWDQIRK